MVVDQLWSDEDEVTIVGPGENVKIKLKGVEEEDISSGFVLCDPTNTCKTGRIFDAQVCYPSFIYLSYFTIALICLTYRCCYLGRHSGAQEHHLRGLFSCLSHPYGS